MAHQNHGLQMLTANRLRDGDVLYRKAGGWVLTLADADVYHAFADALRAKCSSHRRGVVVMRQHPYVGRAGGLRQSRDRGRHVVGARSHAIDQSVELIARDAPGDIASQFLYQLLQIIGGRLDARRVKPPGRRPP